MRSSSLPTAPGQNRPTLLARREAHRLDPRQPAVDHGRRRGRPGDARGQRHGRHRAGLAGRGAAGAGADRRRRPPRRRRRPIPARTAPAVAADRPAAASAARCSRAAARRRRPARSPRCASATSRPSPPASRRRGGPTWRPVGCASTASTWCPSGGDRDRSGGAHDHEYAAGPRGRRVGPAVLGPHRLGPLERPVRAADRSGRGGALHPPHRDGDGRHRRARALPDRRAAADRIGLRALRGAARRGVGREPAAPGHHGRRRAAHRERARALDRGAAPDGGLDPDRPARGPAAGARLRAVGRQLARHGEAEAARAAAAGDRRRDRGGARRRVPAGQPRRGQLPGQLRLRHPARAPRARRAERPVPVRRRARPRRRPVAARARAAHPGRGDGRHHGGHALGAAAARALAGRPGDRHGLLHRGLDRPPGLLRRRRDHAPARRRGVRGRAGRRAAALVHLPRPGARPAARPRPAGRRALLERGHRRLRAREAPELGQGRRHVPGRVRLSLHHQAARPDGRQLRRRPVELDGARRQGRRGAAPRRTAAPPRSPCRPACPGSSSRPPERSRRRT